ncbi:MAG TPA: hypothetical protein VGM88_07125 [Kofleriaceae bacterium]|jgi:hypothetical protein
MLRPVLLALALAACGKSTVTPDEDLGGLVKAKSAETAPIDVARAAKEPAELGRALAQPYGASIAALGPHTLTVTSSMATDGAAALDDKSVLELAAGGAWHGLYTNSADYGREAIYDPRATLGAIPRGVEGAAPAIGSGSGVAASAHDVVGVLFLRPRYQRWHARAPETPDEPVEVRDGYTDAAAATWDLLSPGAKLADLGAATIAGRAGRKIGVTLKAGGAAPTQAPKEALVQRKWRESRKVTALAGEIVLDDKTGVPLAVSLDGELTFAREGASHTMKVSVKTELAPGAVAVDDPGGDQIVATPERLHEVEDRDQLLKDLAPPQAHGQKQP